MKKKPNIIQAIRNAKLFRPLFGDLSTWAAWICWLKAIFAIPMDSVELDLYQKCTGRAEPPENGFKESYAIVGRRGGKSRIVSVAACYIACFFDFREYLAPGERGVVLILARDKDQAKVVFSYIAAILESIPALKAMVVAQRSDEIELSNNIIVSVKTSDYRVIRGVTIACCVADEVSFWDSQGVSPDRAIFAALRPAMATIPRASF
jgi:phage terminase large subunit-like protein